MGYGYKNYVQVAVNGIGVLPKQKPDIEFLLRVTSTPIIAKIIVIDKKVIFSGQLLICVEYVACVPDCTQPVHFVSFEVPFHGIIDHCRARACMNAQLQVLIKFQELQTIDPRNINQFIILKVCVQKLQKGGEGLPCHSCSPCLTVCKPDRPLSCTKKMSEPITCPIPNPNYCESIHHYDSYPAQEETGFVSCSLPVDHDCS